MYITKEGKALQDTTMISRERYEKMVKDGYRYASICFRETAQQAYDGFISKGYESVRIYSKTTRVRGYHELYAMIR